MDMSLPVNQVAIKKFVKSVIDMLTGKQSNTQQNLINAVMPVGKTLKYESSQVSHVRLIKDALGTLNLDLGTYGGDIEFYGFEMSYSNQELKIWKKDDKP